MLSQAEGYSVTRNQYKRVFVILNISLFKYYYLNYLKGLLLLIEDNHRQIKNPFLLAVVRNLI